MFKILKDRLVALHRDEGGADMIEYILIIAIVALPLLGALIWLRKAVADWAMQQWEDVKAGKEQAPGN